MQLWKKNFLAIYFLLLAVIFGGLLFLEGYMWNHEPGAVEQAGMERERKAQPTWWRDSIAKIKNRCP